MRVLLIEDDSATAQSIELMLKSETFNIYTTDLGEEGIDLGKIYDYDIILLDLNLPDMSGFEVLRSLRVSKVKTPILILSGLAGIEDKVRGLGFGADDYMTKPFHKDELVARIRAILRRSAPHGPSTAALPVGDVEIDGGACTVRRRGSAVDLTTVEFDLLAALMRVAGTTVSRQDLVRNVLGRGFSPFDRSIDTHICNLRRKLGPSSDGGERIKGVRGAGYLYTCPLKPGAR